MLLLGKTGLKGQGISLYYFSLLHVSLQLSQNSKVNLESICVYGYLHVCRVLGAWRKIEQQAITIFYCIKIGVL
jgi:hypothetical protein